MGDVVILHGTAETEKSFWFPWLRSELTKRGYRCFLPALPQAEAPDLKRWLPAALREDYTPETILIGHSAGGPLILSVLENLQIQIKQAILVAGYARTTGAEKKPEPILQAAYRWPTIKKHVKELIFINSDNDPWGCDDAEGRYLLDHLGGTLIIPHGQGHMGSNRFNQPYPQFPLLLKLIG